MTIQLLNINLNWLYEVWLVINFLFMAPGDIYSKLAFISTKYVDETNQEEQVNQNEVSYHLIIQNPNQLRLS